MRSTVGTSAARSRNLLPRSQEVSGRNEQEWHDAPWSFRRRRRGARSRAGRRSIAQPSPAPGEAIDDKDRPLQGIDLGDVVFEDEVRVPGPVPLPLEEIADILPPLLPGSASRQASFTLSSTVSAVNQTLSDPVNAVSS